MLPQHHFWNTTNYLRLSLIEQTRVLEGKPTPVDLRPITLCALVESGARFQKPHTISGREVQVEREDARIYADEMKMVTVFMNLIGNALKYSDGTVRVAWRQGTESEGSEAQDESGAIAGTENSAKIGTEIGTKILQIAVLDEGTQGKGITQEQASKLFRAFGRLETHAAIEGTGLGLLSVQKIVEAHGGEVFIEGYLDGTPASSLFSTAKQIYPSMLESFEGAYRTAFVLTCPLASSICLVKDQ